MRSLKNISAINVCIDSSRLILGSEIEPVSPIIRTAHEAAYAYEEYTGEDSRELYCMYRDVAHRNDIDTIGSYGLRYDITVLLSGMVGKETVKTVGHYHPLRPGSETTYPEVYEVLHGEATYLMQRPGEVNCQPPATSRQEAICAIDDVYAVVARPGDKVLIPPGYGHITINAGHEPLVMANWVAAEFDSVYGAMRELKGGAYYLLGSGEWVKNPLYGEVPELRFEKVREYPEFGLISGVGMYGLIREAPEKLRFLTHPEEYCW
jgi:glucose-6-phosphate isomerase